MLDFHQASLSFENPTPVGLVIGNGSNTSFSYTAYKGSCRTLCAMSHSVRKVDRLRTGPPAFLVEAQR